jgi:TRAP transporter TAXI family solute receptor
MAIAVGLTALFYVIDHAGAAQEPESITIATGQSGGLYQPVGGAICNAINGQRDEHSLTCTVEITDGSIENIAQLRNNQVELAMAQSDWQHDAFKGVGSFKAAGPFADLRSVFAVYVENFTVVARGDKNFKTFEDLKGQRVFMGNPGSGQRPTMQVVMKAYGWSLDAVIDVNEFKAASLAQALCDHEFDAFIYTVGHPNFIVKEAITTCNAEILPVTGPGIDRLIKKQPLYVASVIPGDLYPGHSREVPTLSLAATLITRAETRPEIIERIIKAFFENLDSLKEASPVFFSLRQEDRFTVGLTAPLHEGALSYLAELGITPLPHLSTPPKNQPSSPSP